MQHNYTSILIWSVSLLKVNGPTSQRKMDLSIRTLWFLLAMCTPCTNFKNNLNNALYDYDMLLGLFPGCWSYMQSAVMPWQF